MSRRLHAQKSWPYGDDELDRPDMVSAAVTPRLVTKPVEDLSKRTETTRTLVNLDGTLTDEDFVTAERTLESLKRTYAN